MICLIQTFQIRNLPLADNGRYIYMPTTNNSPKIGKPI